MPIRKYGNEPAKVEVLAKDNDPQTLNSLQGDTENVVGRHRKPEHDSDSSNEQSSSDRA